MKKIDFLPTFLKANGKKYQIKTSFKDWIEFEEIITREDLILEEKQVFSLRKVLKDQVHKNPIEFLELFIKAVEFCRCGLPSVASDDNKKVLDFKKDFWAIWADFKTYNGIDLKKEELHWWEFMSLFYSLPQSSQIKKRIEIRDLSLGEISKIKDNKTRREIRRMKELFSLEPLEDDEL